MKGLILSVFLIIAPITALRAAPAATNSYEIEVVVFENRLSDLEGGELWTRDKEKSVGVEKDESVDAGEKPAADSPLSDAATALEKSGRHHVLAHLRWQQGIDAKSASKPVKISNAGDGLDGSLRFYLSRSLILELNLALREPQSGGILSGTSEKDTTVYRLNEPRRIKVLETQYFDHPKFGALVRVSPAKATAGQP